MQSKLGHVLPDLGQSFPNASKLVEKYSPVLFSDTGAVLLGLLPFQHRINSHNPCFLDRGRAATGMSSSIAPVFLPPLDTGPWHAVPAVLKQDVHSPSRAPAVNTG